MEHTGTASYKPGVHWDLLCEAGENLRAWEFRESPFVVKRQQVTSLPEHRLVYLEYEGPISGDRGAVRRVAAGTFDLISESRSEWRIKLVSPTIAGELYLTRSSTQSSDWTATMELQSG